MTFEESLKELESIVVKLEDKNTTLEESIKLFNLGILKSSECMEMLKESKGKVELLVKELDGLTLKEMEVN